jgi:hypothetical protein
LPSIPTRRSPERNARKVATQSTENAKMVTALWRWLPVAE